MEWFRKKKADLTDQDRKEIPDNLWIKCEKCGEILYRKELLKNLMVCTACAFHFPVTAQERVEFMLDPGSFVELDASLESVNPLEFPDYEKKLQKGREMAKMKDSIITGLATIDGLTVACGISDSNFMMGSMASVMGEKIHRLAEIAIQKNVPLILVSAGGGGVRMQEGMVGLMQMAKTAGAMARLHEQEILYISVLTNPTMGGVLASYASLGDIIIAEPGAQIGFAGPRVIKQTIGEELPAGFQTSEFQLEHGIIDLIAPRNDLKPILARILKFHYSQGPEPAAAASAETDQATAAAAT
jgi:acetyl-CoA carboxylase carboxyl transferase subunit beta